MSSTKIFFFSLLIIFLLVGVSYYSFAEPQDNEQIKKNISSLSFGQKLDPDLKLNKLSPDRGSYGLKINIEGNFDKNDSYKILAGRDVFDKVKSLDGKTLTFTISNPFPHWPYEIKSYEENKTFSIPIGVLVIGPKGFSNSLIFNMTF